MLVGTTAWNGEWEGGDIIAMGDFEHEDSRCWKVRGLQKDDRVRSLVNWVLRSVELHYRSDSEGEGCR